jgi:hypothetical protein
MRTIEYSTNKDLKTFEVIKTLMREEPRRVNLRNWINTGPNPAGSSIRPPCQTVGCIAGWADIVGYLRSINQAPTNEVIKEQYGDTFRIAITETVVPRAIQTLQISEWEAFVLFIPPRWPFELKKALSEHDPQTKEYVDVVIKAIDEFLENSEHFCRDANPEEFLIPKSPLDYERYADQNWLSNESF